MCVCVWGGGGACEHVWYIRVAYRISFPWGEGNIDAYKGHACSRAPTRV